MTIRNLLAILYVAMFLNLNCALADDIFYGSAEYNVDSAREKVVDGIAYRINKDSFKDRYYDLENQSNLQNIINGNLELKDRTLAFFSDSTYGILYKDDPYCVYYYDANGFLIDNSRGYTHKAVTDCRREDFFKGFEKLNFDKDLYFSRYA